MAAEGAGADAHQLFEHPGEMHRGDKAHSFCDHPDGYIVVIKTVGGMANAHMVQIIQNGVAGGIAKGRAKIPLVIPQFFRQLIQRKAVGMGLLDVVDDPADQGRVAGGFNVSGDLFFCCGGGDDGGEHGR